MVFIKNYQHIFVLAIAVGATVNARIHIETQRITVTCVQNAAPTDNPGSPHVLIESATQSTHLSDYHDSTYPSSTLKRGLAYNDTKFTTPFAEYDKIGWAWNWDSRSNGLNKRLEFVPTLWGPIDIHTSRWEENARASIDEGSTHLLSFNECDHPRQCNRPPDVAAEEHVRYMNPFGDEVEIGAPSVTNSKSDNEGLDWLRQWVEICKDKNCRYDFCNVHWYSPLDAVDTLYAHIKEAYKICGDKPIWLTEFAPLKADDFASPEETAEWLPSVLLQLDQMPELQRYSFFMAGEGSLVSGSHLTVSGQAYVE